MQFFLWYCGSISLVLHHLAMLLPSEMTFKVSSRVEGNETSGA
jgi:hypothetical protein